MDIFHKMNGHQSEIVAVSPNSQLLKRLLYFISSMYWVLTSATPAVKPTAPLC